MARKLSSVDVVLVGVGWTGGILARELTAAGLSVVGLERASQWAAALTAYRTALSRWPESLGAGIGLGNSLYALGDLAGAERAFRNTIRIHPGAAPAFNNLAQVLLEQGRPQEARNAARQSLALGGPHVPEYQQTLMDIEASILSNELR